jgi:uncharacterized protein (DUF1697 family)
VEMKKLQAIFAALGGANVSTYINSGNVLFESAEMPSLLRHNVEATLKKEFGLEIPTLLKTEREMKKIAAAIPPDWQNDTRQRTDVAYLFEKFDSKKILNTLPLNRDFVDVRYVPGAIFWHLERQHLSKSRLNKLIGHEIYRSMTLRNVNTARFLAGMR